MQALSAEIEQDGSSCEEEDEFIQVFGFIIKDRKNTTLGGIICSIDSKSPQCFEIEYLSLN